MAYGRRGPGRNRTLPSGFSYRRPDLIEDYLDKENKVQPRRRTKLKAGEQRRLTRAVKRARYMALIPYTDDQ